MSRKKKSKKAAVVKQNPKKRNHEVTRGYLKRWANSENQLWVFDIPRQKIEPHPVKAEFAIHDYLYVPEIGGQRIDDAENWFAGAEDELVKFIDRLNSKTYTKPIKAKSLYLTLLGFIGLSLRSAYDLQRIDGHLQSNLTLENELNADISMEVARHRFRVENMIAIIDREARRFCQASVTLMFGTTNSLLVCDRPGADLAFLEGGMHFIPAGPNEYVVMDLQRPPPAMTYGVTFAQAGTDESFSKSINEHTISRARRWIIAKSKEELEAVANELTLEKVGQRSASDKITFIQLSEEQRKRGWRLKDPKT